MTSTSQGTPTPDNPLFNSSSHGRSNGDISSAPDIPPLKLIQQGELATLDIPAREKLIGDWFPERHPCLVYAQTGRGKSLFAMTLGIAVAGGGTAFGWKAHAPCSVLYVDAEMDVADIKERNELLVPTVEGVDLAELGENLHILSRHHQSTLTPFPDIAEEAGRAALMKLVAEKKPRLVILDNLSTLADIKDENDAAAFNPIIRTLTELRQAGCAVILVHHTGKQEGKFRGSSKLGAIFESIIQLAPNRDLVKGDTGFSMRVDKFRGANAPAPLDVQLIIDPETGLASWQHEGSQERKLLELVKAVRSREFGTQAELADELDLSAGEVSKRKHRAIGHGMISGEEWERCFQEARDLKKAIED